MQQESLALIGTFKSVRILNVCEDGWTPTLSKTVARSATLKEIWAEGAGIDGDDLRRISKAGQLRVLMIGRNRFKGRDLACLGDLSELSQLSLGGNEVNVSDLDFLNRLEKLAWLELMDTNLDDRFIPIVRNCNKLKLLSLGKNKLSSKGRVELTEALPTTIITLESDGDQ